MHGLVGVEITQIRADSKVGIEMATTTNKGEKKTTTTTGLKGLPVTPIPIEVPL